MKKIFGILSIILVCVILVGCGGNNSNSQLKLTTQKLSSSVDKIIAQVKKMDDIKDSDIDLSTDLGYYKYDDYTSYSDRYNNSEANFSTPTRNNGIRHSTKWPSGDKQKRFYFVSREAEDNYGDLYAVSYECTMLNDEYRTSRNNLINNCMQLKALLQKLNDLNINVSEADLRTLNSYYEVINSCCNNLSSSASCQSCVKTISGKRANLMNNSSSMMADYIRLCNSLDQSCLSCECASNSIMELSNYLMNLLGEKSDITYNSRYTRNYRNIKNYQNNADNFLDRNNYRDIYDANNKRGYNRYDNRNNPIYDDYNRYNTTPKTSENDTPFKTEIKDKNTLLPDNTEGSIKDDNSYVFNDSNKDIKKDNETRTVTPDNHNINDENKDQDELTKQPINNDEKNIDEIIKNNIPKNNNETNRTHTRRGRIIRRHDLHNVDSNRHPIKRQADTTEPQKVDNQSSPNPQTDSIDNGLRNVRNINNNRTPRPLPDGYKKYVKPNNVSNIQSRVQDSKSFVKLNESITLGPKNVRA